MGLSLSLQLVPFPPPTPPSAALNPRRPSLRLPVPAAAQPGALAGNGRWEAGGARLSSLSPKVVAPWCCISYPRGPQGQVPTDDLGPVSCGVTSQ